MGIFWILGGLLLFGIILSFIGVVADFENCTVIGILVVIIMGGALFFESVALINKKARWNEFIYEYENTKALVESYNVTDYGNMQELTSKVLKINQTIAHHKAYADNWLFGALNTETIGNLEPITFSYNKVTSEENRIE